MLQIFPWAEGMGIIRTTCYLLTLTLFCQDPCDPNPCQNSGECSADGSDFTCSCKSPYSGKQCDINPCEPNPCRSGGECNADGTDFTCSCKPPYSGKQCDIKDPCSPNPCQNDGECNADGTDFTCSCKPLYSGKQCEIDVCKPRFGVDGSYRGINTEMNVCNISDQKEDWSYTGITTGPSEWGKSYPTCNGQSQSPITIINSTVQKDDDLEPLEMKNYDQKVTKAEIINNGHTVTVTPQDDVERSISIEGDTYKLTQIDFHVGLVYGRGSEHRINCTAYNMEIQYMHKNDNDDIAIVAVLLKDGSDRNLGLEPIVHSLFYTHYKGEKTQLKDPLDLTLLLPERPLSIFRYTGSLTTPPCTEGVTWSVATDTVDISYFQRIVFRNLYSFVKQDRPVVRKERDECCMNDNYRPVQPLNGRTVTRSK